MIRKNHLYQLGTTILLILIINFALWFIHIRILNSIIDNGIAILEKETKMPITYQDIGYYSFLSWNARGKINEVVIGDIKLKEIEIISKPLSRKLEFRIDEDVVVSGISSRKDFKIASDQIIITLKDNKFLYGFSKQLKKRIEKGGETLNNSMTTTLQAKNIRIYEADQLVLTIDSNSFINRNNLFIGMDLQGLNLGADFLSKILQQQSNTDNIKEFLELVKDLNFSFSSSFYKTDSNVIINNIEEGQISLKNNIFSVQFIVDSEKKFTLQFKNCKQVILLYLKLLLEKALNESSTEQAEKIQKLRDDLMEMFKRYETKEDVVTLNKQNILELGSLLNRQDNLLKKSEGSTSRSPDKLSAK